MTCFNNLEKILWEGTLVFGRHNLIRSLCLCSGMSQIMTSYYATKLNKFFYRWCICFNLWDCFLESHSC